MSDWRHLRVDGLGPIQKVAATFQIGPPLTHLPFATFQVKVVERADGSFLGVPNVAVLSTDGSPDWISGLGDTVEVALEDTLNYLMQSLDGRENLPESFFVWSDLHDF